MAGGVPREAVGLAVLVSILGLIGIFFGSLLFFMLWRHGERFSYILLLSASTTLGSILGFTQHLDYSVNWREVEIGRFKASQKPGYNSVAVLGKADTGWRLGISYAQIYTYYVDSLLIMFWAITLFIGTYSIPIKPQVHRTMSLAFKTTTLVLPAIVVGICNIEAVRNSLITFLALINIIYVLCLTTGSLTIVAVLYKYLATRKFFNRFFAKELSQHTGLSHNNSVNIRARPSIDKWLIIRFGIIMAILLIFEMALLGYQITNYYEHLNTLDSEDEPDFSIRRAKIDLVQYIPSNTASIIVFCIFGTTAEFRREYMRAMRACFCCVRKRRAAKDSPLIHLDSGPFQENSDLSSLKDVEATGRWLWPVTKRSSFAILDTEMPASPISTAATAVEGPWEAITAVHPKSPSFSVSAGGTTSFAQGPLTPPETLNSLSSNTTPFLHPSQQFFMPEYAVGLSTSQFQTQRSASGPASGKPTRPPFFSGRLRSSSSKTLPTVSTSSSQQEAPQYHGVSLQDAFSLSPRFKYPQDEGESLSPRTGSFPVRERTVSATSLSYNPRYPRNALDRDTPPVPPIPKKYIHRSKSAGNLRSTPCSHKAKPTPRPSGDQPPPAVLSRPVVAQIFPDMDNKLSDTESVHSIIKSDISDYKSDDLSLEPLSHEPSWPLASKNKSLKKK